MADDGTGWGPFGRPLFDSPKARALSRVGVIDVGSNSVRLVVFDGAARSPAYFYNEKVMCGLGRGFNETGRLHPEGRARALAALRRFALIAKGMAVSPLISVATAAVREAADGPTFREEVRKETGIDLWVIDGEEEARLSAQGVLLGWPGAEGLICDIGGSSMELARIGDGKVGERVTSPLGPFRLAEVKPAKLKGHIAGMVSGLVERMGKAPDRLFLVGGSWRAIARLDMLRRNYPLTVLHEYRMTPQAVVETVDWIAQNDIQALRQRADLSEARMALVPVASHVLRGVVKGFRPREIAISSYGIREGMLYEQMPPELRARDPLIESCRFAESKDARMPGFGRQLYRFVMPIFKAMPDDRLRLVRAACLLHDVSWRAHPDYRHEVCFDNATRANLGGLTHQERVFLGLSLLHRYKGSRDGRFEAAVSLLPPKEIKLAEVLGRAMRFGAMFSVEDPAAMGEMRWFPRKKRLEMHVSREADGLFGEVAASRFHALASALDASPVVMRR
ncbi:Ppx/GppA family phosphatase [Roseitranquillus sediminis]|uniref:Ppx/GppA family phosphatase n=1 Tax=Roseitranquillus sediminis TaxID=2809051 RepID=UPI001D0CD416|nr:Ppx/GppA family phosphatase [Roseitranquillus sediminis]